MNKYLFILVFLAIAACRPGTGAPVATAEDSTAVAQDTVVLDTAGSDTFLLLD
jgi:hypothetical protein